MKRFLIQNPVEKRVKDRERDSRMHGLMREDRKDSTKVRFLKIPGRILPV